MSEHKITLNEEESDIFNFIINEKHSIEEIIRKLNIEKFKFINFINDVGLEKAEGVEEIVSIISEINEENTLKNHIRNVISGENEVKVKLSRQVGGSDKIVEIVEYIKALTLVEASELKKALEEEFGVTAAAPMMMVAPSAGSEAADVEEKTEFDIVLTAFGDKKINVIKVVRAHTGLGLKEAKDLVDGVPSTLKEAVAKDEAEKIKKELEEAGATVDMK